MISHKQHIELIEYYDQFDVEDPPYRIWSDGDKEWRNSDGQYHRETDRPAFITDSGFMTWEYNNTLHRELGPARIFSDGRCEYYLDGNKIDPKDFFKLIFKI